MTNSLAIMMMKFDAIFYLQLLEPLSVQYVTFKNALHEQSPTMVEIYDGLQSWFAEHSGSLKDRELTEDLLNF